MNDMESVVQEGMEMHVPATPVRPADWDDVLARAAVEGEARRRSNGTVTSIRPRRRGIRAGLVAAVSMVASAVFVASPLGGPVRDQFAGWVSGTPGTPAASQDQQAFEEENSARAFAFPTGTKLRELARADVAGGVRLLGFRTPDGYCLRLESDTPGSAPAPVQCLPRSTLRRGPSVAVVAADFAFETAGLVTRVSYGFADDSVKAVELVTDGGGLLTVATASNVFLAASDNGSLERITAITHAGDRLPVTFAPALTSRSKNSGVKPGGPVGVERSVGAATISWIEQRAEQGEAPPPGRYRDYWGLGDPVFMRVITPPGESASGVIVALVKPNGRNPFLQDGRIQLCTTAITVAGSTSGGGCTPLADAFDDASVLWGLSQASGSEQVELVSGIASDDVTSVQVYGADGSQLALSLVDNVFVAAIPRTLVPVRLVGRDEDGRVIYTKVHAGVG